MGVLDSVTTAAPQLPTRFVMYAPEKAGKTSFGCQAPNPLFLMSAGETGLLSLIESGQVQPTAHLPSSEQSPTGFLSWGDLLGAVRAVLNEKHGYKTLVIDTGNGAENLLAQHVCETDNEFKGDWGEFNSFGRGERRCAPVWGEFLKLLDQVRVRRSMSIILLYHSKAKQFNNPTGKDYEQWKPEGYEKLWGLTHKWADVIGFYGLRVQVNKDDKAYKEERFLRLAPSAAVVAGNRYGLPDEITSAPNAAALWREFANAMKKAKSRGAQAPASPPPPAPVQAPAPQPAQAAPTSEGEHRADPTKARVTPTGTATSAKPTAPTTSVPTASAPSAGASPTSASVATGPATAATDPKPMPAADRRTVPPRSAPPSPGVDLTGLLAMMHELELSWPEIRDRHDGKAAEIAHAAGVFGTEGMHISELGLSVRNKLRTELETRCAEKRAGREKRAANKAAREAVAS